MRPHSSCPVSFMNQDLSLHQRRRPPTAAEMANIPWLQRLPSPERERAEESRASEPDRARSWGGRADRPPPRDGPDHDEQSAAEDDSGSTECDGSDLHRQQCVHGPRGAEADRGQDRRGDR